MFHQQGKEFQILLGKYTLATSYQSSHGRSLAPK